MRIYLAEITRYARCMECRADEECWHDKPFRVEIIGTYSTLANARRVLADKASEEGYVLHWETEHHIIEPYDTEHEAWVDLPRHAARWYRITIFDLDGGRTVTSANQRRKTQDAKRHDMVAGG